MAFTNDSLGVAMGILPSCLAELENLYSKVLARSYFCDVTLPVDGLPVDAHFWHVQNHAKLFAKAYRKKKRNFLLHHMNRQDATDSLYADWDLG